MNYRLIYKSPITGRYCILFTHCVYCGRKVSLNKKNIGQNRFSVKFYYCKHCQQEKNKEELEDAELETKFRIRIFSSEQFICGFCNKPISLNEELEIRGIGELSKNRKKTHLYIHGFLLSHFECAYRELQEDESIE